MNRENSPSTTGRVDALTWLVLRAIGRRILPIGLAAILIAILVTAASFMMTPRFTATTTMLPRTGGTGTGLISAIGQFANLPLEGEQNLEALYPVIIRSDRILDGLLDRRWNFNRGQESLFGIFGYEPAVADSLESAGRLKAHLRERVLGFRQDKQNGVMELSVTVPEDPLFAAELANALTDSLSRFIMGFKSNKTQQNLDYVKSRIDEVTSELHVAASERTAFLEDNRAYRDSPHLLQIADEYERRVTALTAVWVELIKQLEIAKLDGDKERFDIEVLDRARPPLRRSSPNRVNFGVIGLVLGGLAACGVVGLRALAESGGEQV